MSTHSICFHEERRKIHLLKAVGGFSPDTPQIDQFNSLRRLLHTMQLSCLKLINCQREEK